MRLVREPGEDDEGPLPAPEPVYFTDLASVLGDDEPPEEDSWLIDGVIAAGCPNVIVGAPKAWKSFLMIYVAICVASGRPLFGKFATKQCRVLVLEHEDSENVLVRRIWRVCRGMGIDPRTLAPWLSVNARTPFLLDNHEHVEKLRAEMSRYKPGLVLLDSLRRSHLADENSSKDAAVVTKVWADLCNEFNCAIVPVHHNRKQPQQGEDQADAGQKMRGSSDWNAFIRNSVNITHKKREGISTVEIAGNFVGADDFAFKLVNGHDANGRPTLLFEFVADASKAADDALDARVLKALRDGPMITTELRRAIGSRDIEVGNACRRLQQRGLIDRMSARSPWKLVIQQELPT